MAIERDDDSSVDLFLTKSQIQIEFCGVSFKPKSVKNENDHILKNVSGKFQPGRLAAIIGPSGAGKSSLLNILSGFKIKGVSGTVFVNGDKRDIREFRRISSYIPQNFAMLPYLTTYETLMISADLKLGRRLSHMMKKKVVRDVIQLLNLSKCSPTLVKKLSGGELKRLSIGVELITNPPIMFFDEPTSGLDSVSSIQVISHLRELAHDGRTIICVIHQPSSRLLELFDDIFVLSDGNCIYNGPLDEMVKGFSKCGFHCPNFYNRADFVLEVASKEHGPDLSSLINDNLRKSNSIDVSIGNTSSQDSEISKVANRGCCGERKYPISWLEQFFILTRRSLITMSRDFMTIQLRIICHVLVGGLIGAVFWNIGNDAAKILSNFSCIFFFLMFIFFANAMPTVLTVPLETDVFIREHLNNWYSIGAYYMAKFISDVPIQLICPTLFVSIAYYMTGQPLEIERFAMFWTICVLTSLLSQTIGYVAGSMCSMQLGVFLIPASSIPMLVFSGFFIRFKELVDCLKPLTYISYFRYGVEGAVQALYGFNRTDLPCAEQFCYYKSPKKFLRDMDMEGDRFMFDIVGLTCWILLMQIFVYVSLLIKVKMAQ